MKAVQFSQSALDLAGRIAQAVADDEASEGCDLSAGLFGPTMSRLIVDLTETIEDLEGQIAALNEQTPMQDAEL